MSLQEFSFDDGDNSIGDEVKRLKFKKDQTIRISFAWFPKDDKGNYNLSATPRFTGGNRVYVQNVGYILVNSPEVLKITQAQAKMSVATVVVIWPTDSKGNIDKARMKNGECSVVPWIFSKKKYAELKTIATEWPLGEHDLKITCTEEQYQQTTQTNCRESFLNKLQSKGATSFDDIMERVESVSKELADFIGMDLSIDKLREKMGLSTSGSNTAQTTEEVDDLIDDMLE